MFLLVATGAAAMAAVLSDIDRPSVAAVPLLGDVSLTVVWSLASLLFLLVSLFLLPVGKLRARNRRR